MNAVYGLRVSEMPTREEVVQSFLLRAVLFSAVAVLCMCPVLCLVHMECRSALVISELCGVPGCVAVLVCLSWVHPSRRRLERGCADANDLRTLAKSPYLLLRWHGNSSQWKAGASGG
jgi:hypothetical protein